ncbi:glutamyl aminopeptidase-like [Physella acuta]|uniref:glutamyl aminopeptidase-like n=1 Tax=Physella acuta TaxID=109671 RepID=UPI0027DB93F1|nr:glutamyl aminopeptidase-like [Physella acuta]
MEGTKRRRCPWDLIFLSIFFIVVAVAEGVLVWKLTKDAYETSDSRTCATSETSVTSKPVVQKQEDDVTPWLSYRLPRDVLPVHYDVTIYPNFYEEAHEFSGNVTIEAQVVTSTHYIILHAHPLYVNVTGTHVTDNRTGAEIDVIRTFYHTPHEFFVIQVGSDVNDSVRLTLNYHGVFDQTTVGFYKSDYYNTDTNETR